MSEEPPEKAKPEVVAQDAKDGKSLLDIVVDKYNANASSRTSRLLITAEMVSTVKGGGQPVEETTKFHEKFMKAINKEKKDLITGGCFLMDKEMLVHVIEASTPTLMAYLRLFASETESPFKNARVCSLTEEVPREYPIWGFRAIFMQSEQFEVPQNWLPVMFETLSNLIELGRELRSMTAEEAATFVSEGQSRQLLARLPPLERVKAHVKVEALCTIDEYLDIFDKPISFTLEGERIWPAEPFLQY